MLTNPVFVWAYAHVLLASLVTGAVVMLAVAAWQLRRGRHSFQPAARLALVVLVPSIVLAMLVGSGLGVIEDTYQPMKIAAAEAQWETCRPCSFSLFQTGGGNADQDPTQIIEVPHLLSLLATNSWNGEVVGLNELQCSCSTGRCARWPISRALSSCSPPGGSGCGGGGGWPRRDGSPGWRSGRCRCRSS